MTILGVGSRGNAVGSTAVIVCIVELVDGLVMAIREDSRLAFVGVHIRTPMLV